MRRQRCQAIIWALSKHYAFTHIFFGMGRRVEEALGLLPEGLKHRKQSPNAMRPESGATRL